ncbi:MAG: VOC family protein [Kofleriaceae bacterium]
MNITRTYPVLATTDVSYAAQFYEQHFGLRRRYTSDWYVHLDHPTHPDVNLALVAKDHPSVPPSGRTAAAGVLLTIEVADATAEFAKLCHLAVIVPVRDEAWGQRHFIVGGPDGVLIDIVEPIPPSAEHAAAYVEPS